MMASPSSVAVTHISTTSLASATSAGLFATARSAGFAKDARNYARAMGMGLAVVDKSRGGDEKTEEQGRNRVEAILDGRHECGERVPVDSDRVECVFYEAYLEPDPARDDGDTGDGRRRRVDYIRELLTGYLQPVGDRPHRVPHNQRIRVVVEEDGDTHQPRGELPPSRCGCDLRYLVHDTLSATNP